MQKIDRSTFLYMEPPLGYYMPEEFAQCETCRKYISTDDKCIELGPKPRIVDGKSCCLYSPWPLGKPNPEVVRNHLVELRQAEKRGAHDFVTPKEAGLVERQVRCENCAYFDPSESDCELYEMLNRALPEHFDLDINVKPVACCNAQTKPKGKPMASKASLHEIIVRPAEGGAHVETIHMHKRGGQGGGPLHEMESEHSVHTSMESLHSHLAKHLKGYMKENEVEEGDGVEEEPE